MSDVVPADAPLAAPLSPTFVWVETNRRIDALAHKVERLDEHGSRGVDNLRIEVRRLSKDLEDHERQHQRTYDEQRTGRRWFIGVTVALITPLYPLLIWLVTSGG